MALIVEFINALPDGIRIDLVFGTGLDTALVTLCDVFGYVLFEDGSIGRR